MVWRRGSQKEEKGWGGGGKGGGGKSRRREDTAPAGQGRQQVWGMGVTRPAPGRVSRARVSPFIRMRPDLSGYMHWVQRRVRDEVRRSPPASSGQDGLRRWWEDYQGVVSGSEVACWAR